MTANLHAVPAQKPVQETLQQLIRRRLSELELSTRNAAAHAHGLISHALIARYSNGVGGTLSAKTAQGLALAIDVPVDVVFAAAGMPNSPGPFTLPARADLLTAKERRAVISVVDAILASRDALPDKPKKKR